MSDEDPITNQQAIQAWSDAAPAHVDDFDDEGDVPRRLLLNPAIFALLGDPGGKRILDAGCGQGYLARLLARRGAQVAGVESAAGWYAQATAREQAAPLGILYAQEDLSQLRFPHATLGDAASFDAVIANMVLMDIPDYEPALHACVAALKPGGSLIYSLSHPCFEEESARWGEQGHVAVNDYLREYAIPQTFASRFHRPLSHYLNATIQAACTLQRFIEPGLTAEQVDQAEMQGQTGAWYTRNQRVPSYVVVHAIKIGR